MRGKSSSLATITTVVASVVMVFGATLLLMWAVRYQSATHDLGLVGAVMFAVGAIVLWWQWKQ